MSRLTYWVTAVADLHLHSLLGYSNLELTSRCYVQIVEDDLSEAHKEHGLIDRFIS